MPAQVLSGETLDYSQPASMLAYDKNCVAMTFSRLLGVGVYATINFFLKKGWIAKASDLENDGTIDNVISALALKEIYKDESWVKVKIGMKGHQDGRYYATNWGPSGSAGGKGHAFAIVKNGGVGIYGNNQEVKQVNEVVNKKKTGKITSPSKPYHQAMHETHLISVYGPINW